MHVGIVKAKTSDAVVLSKIHQKSWKSAYRGLVPDVYLNELRSDYWTRPFELWLSKGLMSAGMLFVDGEVKGCVVYGASRSESRSTFGEIVSLYMLPGECGKGYGGELLKYAMEELLKENYDGIYVSVFSGNLKARRFYQRNGFKNSGECDIVNIGGSLLKVKIYEISFKH